MGIIQTIGGWCVTAAILLAVLWCAWKVACWIRPSLSSSTAGKLVTKGFDITQASATAMSLLAISQDDAVKGNPECVAAVNTIWNAVWAHVWASQSPQTATSQAVDDTLAEVKHAISTLTAKVESMLSTTNNVGTVPTPPAEGVSP